MTKVLHTTPRMLAAYAMLAALLAGVLGSCDQGGMYQGGNDDSPRYRFTVVEPVTPHIG